MIFTVSKIHNDDLKLLVIGLFRVTFYVIRPMIDAGELPGLAALMHQGSRSHLESTITSCSLPAWTSFMTGMTPVLIGAGNGDPPERLVGKHPIVDLAPTIFCTLGMPVLEKVDGVVLEDLISSLYGEKHLVQYTDHGKAGDIAIFDSGHCARGGADLFPPEVAGLPVVGLVEGDNVFQSVRVS